MAQIDNLTLEITADSAKAVNALTNLSNALNSFKTSMPTKAKFDNMAQGFKGLREEISKLSVSSRSLEKIKSIGTIARNLGKLNSVNPRVLTNTATGINSLSASLDNISYESIIKIERLSKALSNIPQNTPIKAITNGASKVQAATTQTTPAQTSTTTPVTDVSTEVVSTGAEAKKTTGLLQTLATIAGKLKPVLAALKIGLGFIGKAFKAATKPIVNFVKALARIAFYRFIRSILKSITQGIQQGIQNLALYSKAMEELDAHSANNVMSRYASEFMYFKNAIATALMPLLRGLVPIIETVINRIISLINVIAQLGSAFFGGTFTKAKYVWIDYADSLDKASGSAKALHHQLAGFDELNNLTAPSGGSGGANVPNPADMFEESEINSKIQNFVNKIKGMWEKIKTITSPYIEKLKTMWGKIKEKVLPDLQRIYDNLKEIWNDLLAPIIEEFAKGFLEGLFDGSEDLPDKIDKITERLADWSDKLVELKDNLPIEKLKEVANVIGFLTGKATKVLNPFNIFRLLTIGMSASGEELSKKLRERLAPIVDDLKGKFERLKDWLGKVYDATLNLQNPSSWLSETFETLAMKALKVKKKMESVAEKVDFVKARIEVLKNWLTVFNPFKSFEERAEALKTALDRVKAGIDKIKEIGEVIIYFTFKIIGEDSVKNALDNIKNKITEATAGGKNEGQTNAQIPGANVKKRATGGFVGKGDLFIANEKMPEMIGHIGGNTAVANNDQITQAIAQATYNAMSKALAENGGNVNIVVEGDGEKMFKVFQQKQREYTRRTGLAY